jgi:hypothetical protein
MRHFSRLLRLTGRASWVGLREDPSLAGSTSSPGPLPARGGRSAGWCGDAAPSPPDGSGLRRCCDPTNRAALEPLHAPGYCPAHATRATPSVVTDYRVNDYGMVAEVEMRCGCDAAVVRATPRDGNRAVKSVTTGRRPASELSRPQTAVSAVQGGAGEDSAVGYDFSSMISDPGRWLIRRLIAARWSFCW